MDSSAASSTRFRWAVFQPLFLLLALLKLTYASYCGFWDSNCIDPVAQTAVTLPFQPLLPDGVNLYYAFDAATRHSDGTAVIKAGLWMRYPSRHMDKTEIPGNRTSEVALRIGNLTGAPGGGNHGCDGVWGSQCSTDLLFALKQALWLLSSSGQFYVNPLDTVLGQMVLNTVSIPTCPLSLFDVQTIPAAAFAHESIPPPAITLRSRGTSDSPWETWYIENVSPAEQAQQVAVGILSRAPSFNTPPPDSLHDIQIELVCFQAPSVSGG